MEEIDFESDSFEDVVARDGRYDARAYALLVDVLGYLGRDNRHFSAMDILDEFRDRALDQYGPMSLTVLKHWGVKSCEDVGEMMFNLVETRRIQRDPEDTADGFAGGYDFNEAFLGPYEV